MLGQGISVRYTSMEHNSTCTGISITTGSRAQFFLTRFESPPIEPPNRSLSSGVVRVDQSEYTAVGSYADSTTAGGNNIFNCSCSELSSHHRTRPITHSSLVCRSCPGCARIGIVSIWPLATRGCSTRPRHQTSAPPTNRWIERETHHGPWAMACQCQPTGLGLSITAGASVRYRCYRTM